MTAAGRAARRRSADPRGQEPEYRGGAGVVPATGRRSAQLPPDTDLVLVWGEGFDFARVPAGAGVIFLNAYLQPENGHADVFIPISIQTERRGHYTNFQGVVSAFEPCFAKPASVADAETLFAAIAVTESASA